jgi:hypothetical protein
MGQCTASAALIGSFGLGRDGMGLLCCSYFVLMRRIDVQWRG